MFNQLSLSMQNLIPGMVHLRLRVGNRPCNRLYQRSCHRRVITRHVFHAGTLATNSRVNIYCVIQGHANTPYISHIISHTLSYMHECANILFTFVPNPDQSFKQPASSKPASKQASQPASQPASKQARKAASRRNLKPV